MTVLGPVRADRLAVVLPHEHLFCNTWRQYPSDGLLNDLDLAVREPRRFKAAGGGTLVELTCLVEAGHHARVLLSHDLFRLSHFHAYGGIGFTYLLDEVPQVLRAHGVADGNVSAMLTSNPQRALSAHQAP